MSQSNCTEIDNPMRYRRNKGHCVGETLDHFIHRYARPLEHFPYVTQTHIKTLNFTPCQPCMIPWCRVFLCK